MTRRTCATLALVALMTFVTLPAPAAAATPNHSIFFWKPGTARTGVLKNGVYTQKRTFALQGVSLAAASRSSLALYNSASGKLRTGTFTGGVYTHVETITIRTGFTHAIASCDSLLLYDRATGRILTGTLTGGRFRNRKSRLIDPGWELAVASCSRVVLQKDSYPDSATSAPAGSLTTIERGVLSDGYYAFHSSVGGGGGDAPWALFAANASGYVHLDGQSAPTGGGRWGCFGCGGAFMTQTGSDTGFFPWQRVVGAGTSMFFYSVDGTWCQWVFKSGVIESSSCDDGFATGWQVIAGAR